jgi:hypothetical protein
VITNIALPAWYAEAIAPQLLSAALPKGRPDWERGRWLLGARAPSPAARLISHLLIATVSRFALIAGEGARAPSIRLSLSDVPLFGQGHRQRIIS